MPPMPATPLRYEMMPLRQFRHAITLRHFTRATAIFTLRLPRAYVRYYATSPSYAAMSFYAAMLLMPDDVQR